MIDKNWEIGLKPDIHLELKIDRRHYQFALDAKYRRYETQQYHMAETRQKFEVNTVFDYDLLVTSKMKYLDGLGLNAAFILHPDPDPNYSFFGEEPYSVTPHRERVFNNPGYPAHQYGAIYVSPNDLSQLEKLIRCFLMYHARLEDICWSCMNKLTLENDGLTRKPQYVGDYYQCPDCGRFWISTVCHKDQHHRLIKMGKDSFHKTTEMSDWECVCPACGDTFVRPVLFG